MVRLEQKHHHPNSSSEDRQRRFQTSRAQGIPFAHERRDGTGSR